MARMDRYKKGKEQPVLRASYMPDAEQQFVSEFPEEEIYTEPYFEDENLYPDAFGEPVYEEQLEQQEYPQYARKRRGSNNGLWTLIVLGCMICLCLMGYFVVQLRKPYADFKAKCEAVMQDTFAQGVLVDNVHIGGMTWNEAYQAVLMSAGYDRQRLNITLNVEGYQWILTENELPVQRNIEAVLKMAYSIGRRGSPNQIGNGKTPLQCRYDDLQSKKNNIECLYTHVTYEPAVLRAKVKEVCQFVNRAPVNAQVSFDFNTRSFTITKETSGLYLDEENLYQVLKNALDRQDYQANIHLKAEEQIPDVTWVQLMDYSFTRISSYTTTTTNDKNRNNNVNLAAQAVTGHVVMPGQEFSFNQATGQRTTEKGYLPAAAIAGGTTVDEVGGGVCQVSSTLFNAAVMADMTIVKRSPHTWPSNYVDKGRDATVNWPNLDFVFRNDRTTPVFIVAYYQNLKCTVEIYGASLGPGEGRDMVSQVIDVTEPPVEPIRNYNPELPYGTEKEVKKARTGYVVDTYKIYTRDGQEYKRERLCTSTYRVIQQVIDYNY